MPAEHLSKIRRIARRGVLQPSTSGAGFGVWITVGALVMALVLGLALPAKAGPNDDPIKGVAAHIPSALQSGTISR